MSDYKDLYKKEVYEQSVFTAKPCPGWPFPTQKIWVESQLLYFLERVISTTLVNSNCLKCDVIINPYYTKKIDILQVVIEHRLKGRVSFVITEDVTIEQGIFIVPMLDKGICKHYSPRLTEFMMEPHPEKISNIKIIDWDFNEWGN